MRPAQEFLLDALVGSRTGKLVGYTNAIENGAVVGGSVTDDADAADTEQLGAPVFAIIQPAAEIVERLP